jgi:hypothetical protein
MKGHKNKPKGRYFDLRMQAAYLAGEFSYIDYLDLLCHIGKCQSCLKTFDRLEVEVAKFRPMYYLDEALQKPPTKNCLTIDRIGRLARGDVFLESSWCLYASYHLCFCARCHALYCQFLEIEEVGSNNQTELSLIIPASTLNEKMLIEIASPEAYLAFRQDLGLKPSESVLGSLVKKECLHTFLLDLKYEQSQGGEYFLAFAYLEQTGSFVDGIDFI